MKNLAILFGGRAAEYPISLISASNIIRLCRSLEGYEIFLLGINQAGEFYEYLGPDELIAQDAWQEKPEYLNPIYFQPSKVKGYLRAAKASLEIQRIDVFFPVLHGFDGEGGPLQGLFDILAVPYVGCQQLAAACMMDKIMANAIFQAAGLAQAKWTYLDLNFQTLDLEAIKVDLARKAFDLPVFVKPANAGSSVGISRVEREGDLESALLLAAGHDPRILIEEAVKGRELEVAVLTKADGTLLVSAPGEIIPGRDFYDYQDKYDADSLSQLRIPAPLEESLVMDIKELAARAFSAASCHGLARVDFFLREEDQAILINEINTMPGFTAISMYPKLMKVSGVDELQLMQELIASAKN